MTSTLARAAAGLALAVVLAGCSSHANTPAARPSVVVTSSTPTATGVPSPSPSGEPRTYDGAKAAVDRMMAAIVAHDGATLWDLLTATGQATMSQQDYATIVRECPKLFADYQILSIALNAGGTTATVTAALPKSQGGGTASWEMVYENGRWKHQPSQNAMDWMKLGPKALGVLRNDGACG